MIHVWEDTHRIGVDMRPAYLPEVFDDGLITELLAYPWLSVTEARHELFMAPQTTTYTYGSGEGARTYTSVPFAEPVSSIIECLNDVTERKYNVCFLNRYDDEHQHLGWHADDSPEMRHDHPIAVVSFGEAREIWWRRNDDRGETPPERRQLLGPGSLFIMPPEFQRGHQHRIPKGGRRMGPRVSLTFRRMSGVRDV